MIDLVEIVAIKMAIGNNGGDWATHYTEEQKSLWRERAKEVVELIEKFYMPAGPWKCEGEDIYVKLKP